MKIWVDKFTVSKDPISNETVVKQISSELEEWELDNLPWLTTTIWEDNKCQNGPTAQE